MNMKEDVPCYHSLSSDTKEDKKLLEPFKYILQCTGEQVFTKLTSTFNYWLKIPSNRLRQIDEIVYIIYNAYILFDDVQDNSTLHKNYPVAHSIYGLGSTINAANYVQFIAFEKIVNLHPAATKIFIEEMLEYNRGQGMDMYWMDNFICPTESDYKIMAVRKCGWLVKLIIRFMKLFSTYERDFLPLSNAMGLYYQIHNDYCDFCPDKNTNDKNYCNNLTEGQFSFPIIHALNSNPDDRQIINILRQRTTDIMLKRFCVKLLHNFGSFKYTRDVLEELDKKVRIEIENLGGNPLLVKILDEFKKKISKTYVELLD